MTETSPRSPVATSLSIAAGVGVTLLLIVTWVWLSPRKPSPPPAPHTGGPALAAKPQIPRVKNPGYLGPQACAPCHADRVKEFQQTRHFLAMCEPGPDNMPAGFAPGKGHLALPELALDFEMSHQDQGYFETAFHETPQGPVSTSSRIAFIYGSQGGNDEIYFTWHGDKLNELPMAWLEPLKTWGTSPFDGHAGGDYSRSTTIRCIECHNTWFEHIPGSRNQYGQDNYILGVTCEVCHGPGQEHVAFHQAHPESRRPEAITRPAHLSRERQMDLCAQCHSNALKHRGPAFRYRPGQPLEDFYFSLRTTRPEDDHVANQTTYLRQSRCFLESETLTCQTCHDPHQPRSESNAGAASCLKCHAPHDCKEQPKLPAAVQSDCVGCHMPERQKIQVFFRTADDRYVAPVKRWEHRIGVYDDARQQVLLQWFRSQSDPASQAEADRLAQSLGQHYRQQAEQYRTEYRFLAAINACRESLHFLEDSSVQTMLDELIQTQTGLDKDLMDGLWHEAEGRYQPAIEAFQRIVKVKPDMAMAQAKLGTMLAVTGRKEAALEHLQASVQADHDDPYAPAMLGWLAYLDNRPEDALKYYRLADEVEPYSGKIHYQMGLALARLERWPEAIQRLEKAVEINPLDVSSLHALSQSLRRNGQTTEALPVAIRAAEANRFQDPQIMFDLAELYAANERWDEAIRTAEQALPAAKQPGLVAAIQKRLADYRARRR